MSDIKRALVVGIDNYGSVSLPNSVVNSKTIADLLAKHETGDPNFATRLVKSGSEKVDLKSQITDLFSSDVHTALLYFSGQGYTNDTDDYLQTRNSQRHDPGISVREILQLANNSPAKNRILIFDCYCEDSKNLFSNPKHDEPFLKKGTTILTLSTDCETDDEIRKHGVFSSLLIEALKGGASDVVGRITPGSLYAYVDKALGSWGQRPVFKTNVTEFISLRTATPQINPSIVRKLTEYFPSPTMEFPLNPSFEDTNVKEKEQPPVEPYADPKNVAVFKDLQKLQSIGLVVPVEAPFMFFAAMKSKSCKLTPLGQHYWRLVQRTVI